MFLSISKKIGDLTFGITLVLWVGGEWKCLRTISNGRIWYEQCGTFGLSYHKENVYLIKNWIRLWQAYQNLPHRLKLVYCRGKKYYRKHFEN